LCKAGATIAVENGADDLQLMAIFGWARAEMATLYTRRANRRKLSQDAIPPIVPRTKNELGCPAFKIHEQFQKLNFVLVIPAGIEPAFTT
jgi:hypothetical protein